MIKKLVNGKSLYEMPGIEVLESISRVALCASTSGWNDGSIPEDEINDLGDL